MQKNSLSAGESETMKQLSGKVTQLTEELQDTKLKLDQQVQQNQILGKRLDENGKQSEEKGHESQMLKEELEKAKAQLNKNNEEAKQISTNLKSA